MKLEGKVAVVAGGGRNIGQGVSLLFAAEGAKVGIFDMDLGRGSETVAQVQEQGGAATALAGDVSKAGDVRAMVHRVVEEWGHIDILVNCAAISDRQGLLELPDELWQRVLDVTLTGSYLCSKYVAEQMVKQSTGGAIVNFASGSAFRGSTGRIAYDAAKGGVVSLTQSMAVQLAPHGIRVNCIAPGMTGSQVGGAIPPEKRPFRNLLGRITMPSDMAKVVLFLATEDSEHIIGQCICVDAGGSIMGGG